MIAEEETGEESTAARPEVSGEVFPFARVEFKGNRRLCFTNPMEFHLRIGDPVIVRVDKGEDLGRIAHLLRRLPAMTPTPQFEILRPASIRDIDILKELRVREISARQIGKEKIAAHSLEMKLVDVEYQFDGRKITFYFTADGRVDFRQLVKDLAAVFRTRIELRQIGSRDETRRFSGSGPCGLLLCCASFLTEFCPITTQMAKDQNLPLNPGKISGCCGRLKCCLRFEINSYREVLKTLPRWDTQIETRKGAARVEKLDIFNLTVSLRFNSGEVEKFNPQEFQEILAPGFQLPLPMEAASDEELSDTDVISDDADGDCIRGNAE